MNNSIKSQLQDREFLALREKPRVILKWATGCGKSKMVIDLINHTAIKKKEGKLCPRRVLFLVAERAHINNWQDEFEKWNLRFDKVMTDVACYASLKKYKDYRYDIVVLDEAHHAFSEKRMAALEELRNNLYPNAHIYLLSATLSVDKTSNIEEIFGKFTTSTVTLKDAIKSDILPDPKVYVIGLELNNTIPNQEIAIGKGTNLPLIRWEDRGKYIFKNIPCIIKCTEKQRYIYLTDTMEYWKRRYEHSHNEFQRNKWVNTGSQRKRYLGELKTEAVKSLIKQFPKNRRFVCFCSSVLQANILNYINTISSRRPAKSNQQIIDRFNSKKINQIYAVGMITEGMNLTDIQVGIIVQLDGKERLFIQKFGRSLRAEDPVSFIFYYKGTQDEVYLKNALENIDNNYVQHITINQLNNIKL